MPGGLAVRTVPVPDPGDLLPLLAEPAALAWLHRGEGLVGWGEAARVELPAGVDRFAAGEKWLRAVFEAAEIEDQVGLPGCGPVAFGSFTFDPASEGSVVVIPRAVAGRRDGQAWLTTIGGEPGPPAGQVPVQPVTGSVRWHDGTLTALEWQQAVAAAVVRIRAGSLRKVVLARDLFATAAGPFDVRVLLARLASRYPDCYTFSCAGLVGATPELLIRREEENVGSLVLAGTVPRGSTLAEDRAYGDGLLASAKDAEEHAYVVDSVRDVLARHCDRLEVAAAPSLLRLANLQHLATAATGRLAADASALALAAELHPT
ncbi:MAG: chorismate-binding protein, partial [Actinobacteria bacterium]|nr:chorismate-binding protein [Actinomycetota bacterium]